jgi:hypothetical protein
MIGLIIVLGLVAADAMSFLMAQLVEKRMYERSVRARGR